MHENCGIGIENETSGAGTIGRDPWKEEEEEEEAIGEII